VQTTAASGFGQGGECFVEDNVVQRNGYLHLMVRKEAAPFTCHKPKGVTFQSQWTAGSVMTHQKFSQTYGRFEIKAKMPETTAPGLQFAYWLWPQDLFKHGYYWPMSGELDVMEWYSKNPTLGIPSIHYWHPTVFDPNTTRYNCVVGDMSQWHTYTLEWSPQSIKVLYDGNVCLENTNWMPENGITKPAPFDHPFMISLTQALGVLGTVNEVNPSTPGRAAATVDYVYAWS
jgi:beta-glucanase (GH16 family)